MSAARAAELRNQLRTWDRAYYLDDAPVVDDATYDVALRELRALEAAQPEDAGDDWVATWRRSVSRVASLVALVRCAICCRCCRWPMRATTTS